MNGDAIAITIGRRRGDDWPHWNIGEFSDATQDIANLTEFKRQLMLVIDVLVTASAASTEVRTRRLDPMRRGFDKIDKLGLGELFFFSNDFRRHAFAVDRERNENSLAVVSPDAFSAKSDVFDF